MARACAIFGSRTGCLFAARSSVMGIGLRSAICFAEHSRQYFVRVPVSRVKLRPQNSHVFSS